MSVNVVKIRSEKRVSVGISRGTRVHMGPTFLKPVKKTPSHSLTPPAKHLSVPPSKILPCDFSSHPSLACILVVFYMQESKHEAM
jgi:hypothetical protein